MEKKAINKEAICSCILSIISLFIFWWLGAIGLGLGIRALNEIKNKQESGKVLAIIGIIVGVLSIGLFVYAQIKTNM